MGPLHNFFLSLRTTGLSGYENIYRLETTSSSNTKQKE